MRSRLFNADTGARADVTLLESLTELPPHACPDAASSLASFTSGTLELVRLIGVGGSGEVWSAHQQDLDRLIAVKRLRPETLRATGRKQPRRDTLEMLFHHEAITTGRLEHPNIPPVYFLTNDKESGPMLAMRLITGEPWAAQINREFSAIDPESFLSKHLLILIQVANGVAFAHSRGIIHRDLKPEQVVIGEFGEVLLTDWGLAIPFSTDLTDAKPQGERLRISSHTPVPESVIGSNPSGTPAYMAPEQTLDSGENLGPWTDIYLLGGILYRLLTGAHPHPGSTAMEAFANAQLGLVLPITEVAAGRHVPVELAELAERCLRPEPKSRLETVREFIAAIQVYLSGSRQRAQSAEICREVSTRLQEERRSYEALQECLDRLTEAARLWSANPEFQRLRQKVLLMLAELALANDDLTLARAQTERLADSPEKRALLKELHARLEARNRAAEELRLAYSQVREERNRAEEVTLFLLRDFHSALRRLGRLDLVEKAALKVRAYYDRAGIHDVSPEMLHRRSMALRNIGEVLENQGNLLGALSTYRELLGLATELAGTEESPGPYTALLADAHLRIGQVQYEQRLLTEAYTSYEASINLLQLLGSHGIDRGGEIRADLASAQQRMGTLCWRMGRLADGSRYVDRAIENCGWLKSRHPREDFWKGPLAWCFHTRGLLQQETKDFAAAEDSFTRCLQLRLELSRSDPRDAVRRRSLAWCYGALGENHRLAGDLEKATACFAQQEDLLGQLVHEDPTNDRLQRELAWLLGNQAIIARMTGQLPRAIEYYDKAIAIQRRLLGKDASHQSLLQEVGWNLQLLATMLIEMGRFREAGIRIREAELLVEDLRIGLPENQGVELLVHGLRFLRAELNAAEGDLESAMIVWEQLLMALEPLHEGKTDPNLSDLMMRVYIRCGREVEAAKLAPKVLGHRSENPATRRLWNESSSSIRKLGPADLE